MDLVHTVYEPAGDGPHPAIIAFHGWGSNSLDLLSLAPYLAGGRFMVVCPQGPLEVPIGPIVGYGWFPIRMGTPPEPARVSEAVERASAFIDAAVRRYPVEPRKLVVLGFSQGGVMAWRVAFREPEKFAAVVGISTWFPPELKDMARAKSEALSRMPAMVQHGRADDMIEIGRARESVEHLRELHIPLTYREYDCGHEITAQGISDLSNFLEQKILSPIIAP
jgi:phospholipase/carboxylesterase